MNCSERYPYDWEMHDRDAMPEDWDAQHRFEREMNAAERRAPGGRIRRAMGRRDRERRCLPNKRCAARRDAEWADCPF